MPRSEPEAKGALLAYFWAILAGLLVPVLIILIGMVAQILNSDGLHESSERLGSFLTIPLPDAFSTQNNLIQLTEVVAVVVGLSAVFCFSLWMNRRAADNRARRITRGLHERLLRQSLRRAELEGAAAQYVRAESLIGTHLPNLGKGLSLWYRSIPRSVLLMIGSVVVALLVDIWLTLLAVVSAVLVWQLYQRLRHFEGSDVARWEVPRARTRMAEIVGRAPLLGRLQTQGLADRAFTAELDTLYRRLADEDARRARVWPLLFLASSVAIAVLLLGLGVNILSENSGLSLPAALVLGLSLTAAAVAAGRLVQLAGQLRKSKTASESIYLYLVQSDEIAPSEQRVGIVGLRESVEIQDVTINGVSGEPTLSNLSLKLAPKSLVALLGTDLVSTRALTELIMGFGHPSTGKVLIDGINLQDVHPQALARNVMWIEPDGPIWDDTIEGNIRGSDDAINNGDIVDALEKLGSYERIQRLPDGLSTLVAAGESGLDVEMTYAIAIARAMLHKPPILLVMEPPAPSDHPTDDPYLAALRDLALQGTLVVVLPRRLPTLRAADRVVLLNQNQLVGEGKHSELLSGSDLYRHLNYLLFNPYRHK